MSEQEFLSELEKHQGIIHKVCMIYTRGKSDHDDLFQEIVYQAWRSFSNFKGESKLSTWLYRVSLYTALTQKKKKRTNLESYSIEFEYSLLEDGTQENIKQLYALIEQLKPIEKAVIMLYLEEKTYEEIADILGFSVNNVGVKLNRIKSKLKALWN